MNLLTPERFIIDDTLIEKDYDYMRRMIPDSSRQIFDFIEDICDRLEYEGSFLYDECPDKTTIHNMTDKIYNQFNRSDGQEMISAASISIPLKDFIQTLLCDEILYRRCRYYRKKKMFE